ncbi:MAG: transposase [Chryseobacterium sp.]|nr:transposase [Chryseobacterium sp.]
MFTVFISTLILQIEQILYSANKNRSTNASAESLNVKIKNFRMQLRGVKGRTFFPL